MARGELTVLACVHMRAYTDVKQEKKKGKKKSKQSGSANAGATMAAMTGQPAPATATTTSAAPAIATSTASQRNLSPRVEEVFDDDEQVGPALVALHLY